MRQPHSPHKRVAHTWWTATIASDDGERTEPLRLPQPAFRSQALDYLRAHLPPGDTVTALHGGANH